MRIEHKKQVLELTDTLKEALQFLNTPEASTAEYLQEDCLACIAHIASQLEEVQNKEYVLFCTTCEADIRNRNFVEAYKSAEMLSMWIEEFVQVHYEIVFLPYKAEMWDALDSVWRAASADPTCMVRTIPIPYYTFDSKGEAVSAEYDGDRFPSYVEVTHYNDYDLSSQRPDVIFIHNPYDDCNTVTMVHPHFFSSNLINYTDKLVYIPYYVSLGKIIHSFRLPSYKNAWKIFVQSESTRQEFLQSGEVQPSQVVALGSPKIDYVYNRMQEGTPMPLEWEGALKGRTVFLFNSTLGRLLNEKEDIIKSMEEIFRFFQKRQDIALIWRPHPLSIKTLQSMLPHLLDSYLMLVEKLKKLPNAVYDDSQEMHTAIVHSDAYIGDFSSVIVPYAVTGKPILKLMPNIKSSFSYWGSDPAWLDYKDEVTVPVHVSPAPILDGSLLFPALNRGGMFSLELNTGKISFIQVFPNIDYNQPELFAKACAYQDTVWLVPDRASELVSYNRTSGEMRSYTLPPMFRCEGEHKFSNAIQHDHYLWMLPAQSNMLVRLDMESGEMVGYSMRPDNSNDVLREPLCSDGIIHNNCLWVTLCGKRSILQIDLTSQDMKLRELHFLQEPIQAITSDGQNLWIVPEKASVVVKWDPQSDDLYLYNQWPQGFDGGEQPFSSVVFDGQAVWLVPYDANKILKITSTGEMVSVYSNLKKSKWSILNSWYPFVSPEQNRTLVSNDTLFSGAVLNEDWIWFFPVTAPAMVGIHLKNGEVREIPVALSRWQDEQMSTASRTPYPPEEGVDLRSTFNDRSLPLAAFVDMVGKGYNWGEKQRNEVSASIANADGTCGQKIWGYITGHFSH
ncbi:CDP-glycerol glycerophosphotransferase family protein [Paenibacillus sp. 32352]|uniref:CDP-glycerol glycerophosphotransferase family protein n=1 Tax=Paenibacillus sp. 32352 TaxID=1969111 RepID=UPI0009ACD3A1|nr:CDP-glycerol glycerophosphotransferase family protein [Paenibacillus sp. 32352]